jgi:hypothetical protein
MLQAVLRCGRPECALEPTGEEMPPRFAAALRRKAVIGRRVKNGSGTALDKRLSCALHTRGAFSLVELFDKRKAKIERERHPSWVSFTLSSFPKHRHDALFFSLI